MIENNIIKDDVMAMTTRDDDILWMPSHTQKQNSNLWKFALAQGIDPEDYDTLQRWSVSQKGAFWGAVWDFCEVVGEKGKTAFEPSEAAWMTGARFFPEARLNLTENFLKGAGDAIAVVTMNELGSLVEVTRKELMQRVARVADGLCSAGVNKGDRVAGIQPNDLDALVALMATLSIGAVWTSCSPDFGKTAIIDRIGQVAPKVLFASPNYRYGGKEHDICQRIAEECSEKTPITPVCFSGEGVIPGVETLAQECFCLGCDL